MNPEPPPIADPHSTERRPFQRSAASQKFLWVVFVSLILIAIAITIMTGVIRL